MGNKAEKGEKYCGNCSYHNVYEYPSKIFCTYRLVRRLNPVVPTLWCCENWTPAIDKCFCIEDAKKQIKKQTGST